MIISGKFLRLFYSIVDKNQCTSWSSDCYECIDAKTCSSCQKGFYLLHKEPGLIGGQCMPSVQDTHTVNVFVKPEHVETTGDGTYANPFGHIVKALSYANEQAADKGETSINIYLLGGGNHYMTKNIEHSMYAASKSNAYSYNQNIVIQPAFWGETLGGHTFGASDSNCIQSTEKITVYYKLGSYFSFIVPKSLTVKSIIFDALDSAINPQGNKKPNHLWTLKYRILIKIQCELMFMSNNDLIVQDILFTNSILAKCMLPRQKTDWQQLVTHSFNLSTLPNLVTLHQWELWR